jgi:hypothetical protein
MPGKRRSEGKPPPLFELGSLFERRHVVSLQKVEKRRALGLEAKLGAFSREPFFPLGIFIREVGLDAGAPRLDFINRLLLAVAVEPINQLLVRGAGRKQGLYIISLDTFEAKQHLIEGTSEVVFSDHPVQGGSPFVSHACRQCVIAQASAGAAGRFLSQIFERAHV